MRKRETGFKGVMMPGNPAVDDHSSAVYDKVWASAVGGETPLPFHILTGKSDGRPGQTRGPQINGFLSIIRGRQDGWVAFRMKDMCNARRLTWANDFPRSDSTWPLSQTMLEEHTKGLGEQERNWMCHDNVAEPYKSAF